MSVSVNTRELSDFARKLERLGKKTPQNIRKGLKAIGTVVYGDAVAFAPRSMTKSEYVGKLKGGKTKRSTSSFTSGSLKKSIKMELKSESVEIGVPSNSKAGDYAEKVHSTWKHTPHNPPPATDEFIFKAYTKNTTKIERALDHVLLNLINEL